MVTRVSSSVSLSRLAWVLVGLMLTACGVRDASEIVPEGLRIGSNHTVFVATSRAEDENGAFGFERSKTLNLLELTVSVPPNHKPGELTYGKPDPATNFVVAAQEKLNGFDLFRKRISAYLDKQGAPQREITIFVHGYNTTQNETAFRTAQVAEDVRGGGVNVLYSWPSRGAALGYTYDNDSMLFARDGLEQLIRETVRINAERVVLVAHSLGSALTMEVLRQIEIQEPGWARRNLGGVILISPDLDIEVFKSQVRRVLQLPEPFIVFVSKFDPALSLSARLRGEVAQLGNVRTLDGLEDLPINIVDVSAFSKTAENAHFVPASSPLLLALLEGGDRMIDTFDRESRSFDSYLGISPSSGPRAQKVVLRPADENPR